MKLNQIGWGDNIIPFSRGKPFVRSQLSWCVFNLERKTIYSTRLHQKTSHSEYRTRQFTFTTPRTRGQRGQTFFNHVLSNPYFSHPSPFSTLSFIRRLQTLCPFKTLDPVAVFIFISAGAPYVTNYSFSSLQSF